MTNQPLHLYCSQHGFSSLQRDLQPEFFASCGRMIKAQTLDTLRFRQDVQPRIQPRLRRGKSHLLDYRLSHPLYIVHPIFSYIY